MNRYHLSYVRLLWNHIIWKLVAFWQKWNGIHVSSYTIGGFLKNRAKKKANTVSLFNKYLLTCKSFKTRTKLPHWKQLCDLGLLIQCLWQSESGKWSIHSCSLCQDDPLGTGRNVRTFTYIFFSIWNVKKNIKLY